MEKKEKIVTLNKKQFESVVKNTFNQAKKELNESKETTKVVLNENWFVDMTLQMGDFVFTHSKPLFESILKVQDEFKYGYDLTDPEILGRAKQAVGKILCLPAGVASFAGITAAGTALLNKYADSVSKVKDAFFAKFARS